MIKNLIVFPIVEGLPETAAELCALLERKRFAPCGRTDFPGGNVDDMFRSLQALAALPGDPTVFPGHWYSAAKSAPLDSVRRSNYVYRASSLDQWRTLMGG